MIDLRLTYDILELELLGTFYWVKAEVVVVGNIVGDKRRANRQVLA
jgi:hypothetical protein